MEKSHGSVLLDWDFLLLFSPRKPFEPGNNNPKTEKFGLLLAIPARIQNNILVMQDS